ncbi:hypothetical protein [Piscinibacter sp. HJYY11]|uniref:hypothetical protein n=1 Tax=Piscinibacter sp. HJYY11 TaxID=2801333 RepID=UPI00191F0BC8|nr:hypothetical protein [Piscinibacter sp. HJYY11]MBL0726088.1 hypothetical protein [Piscinibacter sp. HJYY11]
MRKLATTIALLLCGHLAHAVELTVVTAGGYVRFNVPDDWQVLKAQTKPPVAAIVFQIANPADSGTPHSTNVIVSLFAMDTEQGKAAMSEVGKQYGPAVPTVRTQDGWTTHSQTTEQQGARYNVVDAVRKAADVTVSIRFAWPALPNNPANYDKSMIDAMQAVQRSVVGGFGVPPARLGEVIRRPTQ